MKKILKVTLYCVLAFSGILLITIWNPFNFFDKITCKINNCQEEIDWFKLAVQKRDPSLCNNMGGYFSGDRIISKEENIYLCKAYYGGEIGDFDYCNNLNNSKEDIDSLNQQYICFRNLFRKTDDISICERIPNFNTELNIKYECYSSMASKTKDKTICYKIPEGNDEARIDSRKGCLIGVERELENQ